MIPKENLHATLTTLRAISTLKEASDKLAGEIGKLAVPKITDEEYLELETLLGANPYTVYRDRNDELTERTIRDFWSEHVKHPDHTPEYTLYALYDEAYLGCSYTDQCRREHVQCLLQQNGYEDTDFRQLDESLYEQHGIGLYELCSIHYEYEWALDEDVPVRFEMISNYDCINSYFFESGNYSTPLEKDESYLGDIIRVLKLNPMKLSDALDITEASEQLSGDESYVDEKDFAEEFRNTTCGANLLTLAVMVPFGRLHEKKFTIPKGSNVGLYSTMYGGGSLFDCQLKRDMEIELKVSLDETDGSKYPYWRMIPDCCESYSMHECYGSYGCFD